MKLKDALFYTIKPEYQKKTWEKFSSEIGGVFKFYESIRANVNGPIYVYDITAKLEDFDLKIKQTVYIKPGGNDKPTPLTYCLSRKTNQKIFFRIWKKDFFEKIFGFNKTNTGIAEIDKNYSLKTNHRKLEQLIKTNGNLREILTSSRSHFHIVTKNKTLEIVLKRSGISKSVEDLFADIELIEQIIKEIGSL